MRPVGLSSLYEGLGWFEAPGDPRAVDRFNAVRAFARALLGGPLSDLASRGRVRVVDVMGGTGIAGVAFASALAELGLAVDLTVVDARPDALGHVDGWVEAAGLGGRVSVAAVPGSADMLPELVTGPFDLALVWGSSLPHLDVYSLHLLLAGLRELQPAHGALIVEQKDLLSDILVNNAFRHVMVTGDVLTVYRSYDRVRGVQVRLAYRAGDLSPLGTVESRLWGLAEVAAAAWIFYGHVTVMDLVEFRPTNVVVARGPRTSAPTWRELRESTPRAQA